MDPPTVRSVLLLYRHIKRHNIGTLNGRLTGGIIRREILSTYAFIIVRRGVPSQHGTLRTKVTSVRSAERSRLRYITRDLYRQLKVGTSDSIMITSSYCVLSVTIKDITVFKREDDLTRSLRRKNNGGGRNSAEGLGDNGTGGVICGKNSPRDRKEAKTR